MMTAQEAQTPNYRWLTFALLGLAYMLVFFHRTCPAVVALDLMKDLQAGPALMGNLAAEQDRANSAWMGGKRSASVLDSESLKCTK